VPVKNNVDSIIHLTDMRGRIILGVYGVGTTFVAMLNLDGLVNPALGIVALALLWAALIILAVPGSQPFSLTSTISVVVVGVAVTVVSSWNIVDVAATGYATWHMGAVTFLMLVVAIRGRTRFAWIGFGAFAAITIIWSVLTQGDTLFGVNLAARQAATLLIGTLFATLLRRSRLTISAIQASQLSRAAAEAATDAETHERTAHYVRLETEARPALERIARGAPFTTIEREQFALLEASLRDGIRAAGLSSSTLAVETRAARERGVHVILLDDRGSDLGEPERILVESTLTEQLRATEVGTITARLSPYGRPEIATIVVDEGGTFRRVVVSHDGVEVAHLS
jgi:guanyl-specific ribonuclease Sa